ncbi:hypothetical protein BDW02DRAFT_538980 [Decorospora gaudefroyi]|uniref:AMMECR1 domain-containing protein n=1 Tax=Decorospora gaudefroyi TaxID=184978 RepID=A0A6A5KX82_9PLEO|nr:hypothetical protein BDW02DRAFT_538980 [Decorospora gaudefroyi]
MATQAHCAYCFESLVASLEKRQPLSLSDVEVLWAKYNSEPTTTSELADETEEGEEDTSVSPALGRPAAISRLLASPPSSASSSSLQSASSTPSGGATSSSATSQTHPLFVTWNTISRSGDHRLRGCIGTFEALPLASGLSSYALTSAFDDTRFNPISARELPSLEVAVTLLTDFEPAAHPLDWDIGVHGLRISFSDKGRRYGSTYLPDVAREQGWSKEEALVSLMRKAGWGGKTRDWEKVGVRVTRYQGKKVALAWGQWKEWRYWVREEMADR